MGDAQSIFMKKDGQYPPATKFTKAHSIPIPARPFFGKSEAMRKGLERAIAANLKKQLGL
jgi:hypothetical protein